MRRRTPGTAGLLALAVATTIAAGCAPFGGVAPPEEAVRQRAQAWADALLAGDWQGAYSYTSPSYRQFATAGTYHARIAGTSRWDAAEVRDVSCSEDLCEVTFLLEYPAVKMEDTVLRRPRTYKWVRTDGEWWLYVAP